jgi:serine/threonine protein kinase
VLHFFDPARGARSLTRDDPTGFAAPPAFGPFRVLHQIGVGALGPVFRTYEPTRDRLVAVKVFRLDVTPEQAIALADELGRASEGNRNLFHPSIVEPVSAGVEGTVAYRAEEYVAAESLDVAMRHYAPAALDKVLPFITQLASAIDFARQAGVGHGALHPRDIFVTPDEARATGFGVVDALDRLGLRAPVRRPYSPPERIAGERWGTPADVFSLAAITFELLTGRRPLGLGDQIGPLTGANVGEYGEALRAVLVRAMREHPVERYATAMEFATELARAAGQVPTTKVASPAPVQTPTATIAPAARAIDEPAIDEPALEEPAAKEAEVTLADASAPDEGEQESLGLGLSLEDSPREVARKVIAARKRQSQSKAKTHGRQESDAAVSLLLPPDPVPESIEITEPTSEFATESMSGPSHLELPDDPSTLATAVTITDALSPVEGPAVDAVEATEPEPVDAEPPMPLDKEKNDKKDAKKDAPERVADLDEFRPREREREIDAFRAERSWPRAADRSDHLVDLSLADLPSSRSPEPPSPRSAEPSSSRVSDSSTSRPLESANFWSPEPPSARGAEPSSSRLPDPSIERAVMPKPTALEPFDPELPPPLPLRPTAPPPPDPTVKAVDDTAPAERPRTMMLPTAVGLMLGLLGGYLAGYTVGSRDGSKQVAQTSSEQPRAEAPASAPQSSRTAPPSTPAASEPAASATRGQSAATTTPTDGRASAPVTSEPRRGNTPAASEPKRAEGPPPVPKESSSGGTPASSAGGTPPSSAAIPPSTSKPTAATPPAAKPPAAAATAPVATREPRKPDAATATGRIVVTSTPSRAAVTVNGVWSGRTPLTLADRPFGKYVVRIVEAGFAVARQEFVLSSSAPTRTIEVTLEPSGAARGAKPADSKPQGTTPPLPVESQPTSTAGRGQAAASTGSIYVDSRPRGARVLVDGKDYGVTPTTVPGLTLGQHTVRLELADHAPWTKTETVTAGTTARVTGSLEPMR